MEDFRAYRIIEVISAIAMSLGGTQQQLEPGKIFPSLKDLKLGEGEGPGDDDENVVENIRQMKQVITRASSQTL